MLTSRQGQLVTSSKIQKILSNFAICILDFKYSGFSSPLTALVKIRTRMQNYCIICKLHVFKIILCAQHFKNMHQKCEIICEVHTNS